MRVKRKYIYAAIFILLVIIVIPLIITLSFTSSENKDLKCLVFTNKLETLQCGVIGSSDNKAVIFVAGKVAWKKNLNNKFYFGLKTLDSKGRAITISIDLPEEPIPVFLIQNSQLSRLKEGKKYTPSSLPSSEILKKIRMNEDVVIQFPSLDDDVLVKAKTQFPKAKFLKCARYHKDYLKYLRNSTLSNKLNELFSHYTTGCNITIFGLTSQ